MMVFVLGTETPKRLIMSHDDGIHLLGYRSLPCIVLAHAARSAPLQ